jgi:hypothetical protein
VLLASAGVIDISSPPSLAKIATLLVKTVAKPVSKRIKKDFSRFEPTRKMLIGIGQASNSITSRMTIWADGYTVRHIKPLPDDTALTTGADFVGESFILLVSIGTMVWEYNRSNEKTREKEEKIRAAAKAERDALQANFLALDDRLKAVEEVVEYNSQSILNISGKRYKEPPRKQLVPISHEEEDKLPQAEKQKEFRSEAHHVTQISQPDPDADTGAKQSDEDPSDPWWKFW